MLTRKKEPKPRSGQKKSQLSASVLTDQTGSKKAVKRQKETFQTLHF
jgi:hypothetical protein